MYPLVVGIKYSVSMELLGLLLLLQMFSQDKYKKFERHGKPLLFVNLIRSNFIHSLSHL